MASRKLRPIRIEGNVAYVPLTRGYEATLDVADVGLLESFNWQVRPHGRTAYAQRSTKRLGKKATILLHRLVLGAPDGIGVDHINGDGLDNRRCNLRLATREQNQRNRRLQTDNTSGFKGVSWHKRSRKWNASIMVGGKKTYLGDFDTPEAAHAAYVEAAKKHFGDFARAA